MTHDTLAVCDGDRWGIWKGPALSFNDATPEKLAVYKTVLICEGHVDLRHRWQAIIDWKRDGLLGDTRLISAAYKGRHIWSPENDPHVAQWVVHARSEREVLDSDGLVYVPVCLKPTLELSDTRDDGYLFMGGRKWRELGVGTEAIGRSGLPARVITDFAPAAGYANINLTRDRVPYEQYITEMARARVVVVPLMGTPISHGHTEVVNAILLGKPVVVTAGASCDDYVEHDVSGLLVPDNSVEAWVEALHKAHRDAERLTAGARARTSEYHGRRYVEYIQEVIDFPERRLIPRSFKVPHGNPDRSEWNRANAQKAAHEKKVAHLAIIRAVGKLLSDGRYAEIVGMVQPCLDGPCRIAALTLLMRAEMRLDLAGSEKTIRTLIAEAGESSEFRSNLAAALWAQKRETEALTEAAVAVAFEPTRVASRTRLITYLRRLQRPREAMRLIEDGLAIDPAEASLLRLKNELAATAEAA